MRSFFEVTGPNGGGLLTTAEAKAALGLTDNTRDADVARLIAKVSAAIYRACNLRTDGISPPSLLSEEIVEKFRYEHFGGPLQLSRRRVTELTITEGGAALDPSNYELNRAAGQILRLDAMDRSIEWAVSRVVVEYVAGFETVPDDLKLATETWLRTLWRDVYETPSTISDPFVKVEEIPGVRRIERWVSDMNTTAPSTATLLPQEVKSILLDGGYIEMWIA